MTDAIPTCEAHDVPRCPACSRILAEHLTDGQCNGCLKFGHDGTHRATCPYRIVGGVEASRPVTVFDEPVPPATEYHSLKGRRKTMLIRRLAAGETQKALAVVFNVDQSSISDFKKRHAVEIAAVKRHLDDKFAGLWVAEQFNRVAVLQEAVERAEAAISASERTLTDETGESVDVPDAREWSAELRATLRDIATELGQLPNKATVVHDGGVKIQYEIVGVDPSALS